jgi:hypothetical protein
VAAPELVVDGVAAPPPVLVVAAVVEADVDAAVDWDEALVAVLFELLPQAARSAAMVGAARPSAAARLSTSRRVSAPLSAWLYKFRKPWSSIRVLLHMTEWNVVLTRFNFVRSGSESLVNRRAAKRSDTSFRSYLRGPLRREHMTSRVVVGIESAANGRRPRYPKMTREV